ncbi:YceD family protein [Histidinibacterium lentulum]|uniref:DUF177 domain-containing protein n=1 Tax=Histidinibacterium lentulum TaxID=2480588 RepID=A0A3N2QYA0_9RHOB|nr:DUF177 domain-containing protein [Histidinibacterium lentulum]ROU00194.1 DUF177 domain-containing protein [Histidinibacterium lentulum]
MTAPLPTHPVRLRDLPVRAPTEIRLEPDADGRAALAEALELDALRKFRFEARLSPSGEADWVLTGLLGATVVQPCVVTLEPVTTRIDEPVERRYLARWFEPEGGSEVEMPEDDRSEPLPETLDLYAVAREALALALPDWPRAEGAAIGSAVFAGPGLEPMTDDDARPFAALKALRPGPGGDPDGGAADGADAGPEEGTGSGDEK